MADEIKNLVVSNIVSVLPRPMVAAVPSHTPPPEKAGEAVVSAVGLENMSAADVKLLSVAAGADRMPIMAAAAITSQTAAATATVWQSGKRINNQWTINQNKNSWIGVSGIGWQKLSTASDSGCVSLTMLSGNAIITKASVSYRTESDGMVHEMYVF